MKRFFALTAVALAAASAHAAPVAYDGSYYEYVAASLSWTDAAAAAAASSYNGLSGHLATISSAAENAFVTNLSTWTDAWLGATKTADGWAWVDGSSFSYANWLPGEPNNYGGNEDNIVISYSNPGSWNDIAAAYTPNGYLVEYSTASVVPEPAGYALLLAGLAVTGVASQRRTPARRS
jgi:hypothetical protein